MDKSHKKNSHIHNKRGTTCLSIFNVTQKKAGRVRFGKIKKDPWTANVKTSKLFDHVTWRFNGNAVLFYLVLFKPRLEHIIYWGMLNSYLSDIPMWQLFVHNLWRYHGNRVMTCWFIQISNFNSAINLSHYNDLIFQYYYILTSYYWFGIILYRCMFFRGVMRKSWNPRWRIHNGGYNDVISRHN